jgi:hypothetical protein
LDAIAAVDNLWVPANAFIQSIASRPVMVENGRSIWADGSSALGFAPDTDREEFVRQLVRHFEEAGWRQRNTHYLNPGLATSFESGWQSRCACAILTDPLGKPIPREPFHEWHGEWESIRGDVLTYDLSAEGPELRGYASFVPRRLVNERR